MVLRNNACRSLLSRFSDVPTWRRIVRTASGWHTLPDR